MMYALIAGLRNRGMVTLYREGKWIDAAARMEEMKGIMDRARVGAMVYTSDWGCAVRADEVVWMKVIDEDTLKEGVQ